MARKVDLLAHGIYCETSQHEIVRGAGFRIIKVFCEFSTLVRRALYVSLKLGTRNNSFRSLGTTIFFNCSALHTAESNFA